MECTKPPAKGKYVGIGFWKDENCEGDPVGINYHNVDFGEK